MRGLRLYLHQKKSNYILDDLEFKIKSLKYLVYWGDCKSKQCSALLYHWSKTFFPFPDIGQRARKEMNAVSISIVTVANLYFYFLTVVGSSRSIIGQSLFFTFPVIGQGLEKK